jgi:O-acetyl-ADP-ribose deacetylase (regulator of RNase III)
MPRVLNKNRDAIPKEEEVLTMPIESVRGDILKSMSHVLVNPVNCVGVMGAGLALQFKKKYPTMFAEYKRDCRDYNLTIGFPKAYKIDTDRYVVCFPTKDSWQNPSKLEWIVQGLENLVGWLKATPEVKTISVPKIGCGLGGLGWDVVRGFVISAFTGWDGHVYLYD